MGQEADFWGPYVEEWDSPPVPKKEGFIVKMGRSFLGRTLIRCMTLSILFFSTAADVGACSGDRTYQSLAIRWNVRISVFERVECWSVVT